LVNEADFTPFEALIAAHPKCRSAIGISLNQRNIEFGKKANHSLNALIPAEKCKHITIS